MTTKKTPTFIEAFLQFLFLNLPLDLINGVVLRG